MMIEQILQSLRMLKAHVGPLNLEEIKIPATDTLCNKALRPSPSEDNYALNFSTFIISWSQQNLYLKINQAGNQIRTHATLYPYAIAIVLYFKFEIDTFLR